jgi:nucleotide-binding universal stress UspA family protein
MRYKTILVHIGSGAGAEKRIRLAARLARSMGAHLVGSAPTGISRFLPPGAYIAGGRIFAARCEALRRAADEGRVLFERIAAEEGVVSIEARVADDDIDAALALQARYCDLVVVAQAAPAGDPPPQPADLPACLLLSSGRPVLTVPAMCALADPARHVLVAWDGSVEAARAVADALPLLRIAQRTTVLGFGDETVHAGSGMQDCERLAAWLGRHGIEAQVAARALGSDVGEALLSAAADLDASLLVMGAYGHARLRELALGGVSATVLRAMTLPVLLAH